jgi:putative peptidoglycan lipid II flippase
MPPGSPPQTTKPHRLSVHTVLVASGMLISRLSGYVRVTLFSHIFGLEAPAADAFNQALRIPNFLQNLLGEGVLSASLIPVYSGLMVTDRAQADRVAKAVLGALALITAILVLVGVTWTPHIVTLLAPGYHGAIRDLTIHLVRIFFPGIGLLVLSAWCLAILNSHHRFFVSYAAPVCWNAALITVLSVWRADGLDRLAVKLAWGAVAGSALQLAVQVPFVWGLVTGHGAAWGRATGQYVKRVLSSSVPVIFTRGVVQVSAVIDGVIATLLPLGAVTALANATQLYQLPVALFGMAVSSAALPSMSTEAATNQGRALRARLVGGQETIAVLVVPSMVAFLVFGDIIVALLLEHGKFTHENTRYVWGVLAGSAVGLLATTISRLYVSAFYALGDTRTPTRIAMVRVTAVATLGYTLAVIVPPLVGVPASWGTAGLTASAGVAGWIEFALLRRALRHRLGDVTMPAALVGRAWLVAALAALAAIGLRWVIPVNQAVLRGIAILGVYGGLYLLGAQWAGLLGAADLIRRVLRRGP